MALRQEETTRILILTMMVVEVVSYTIFVAGAVASSVGIDAGAGVSVSVATEILLYAAVLGVAASWYRYHAEINVRWLMLMGGIGWLDFGCGRDG